MPLTHLYFRIECGMIILFILGQALCDFEDNAYKMISESWHAKPITCLMKGVSFVSKPEFNAAVPSLAYFLGHNKFAEQDFVGVLTNMVTVFSLKYLVNRQRPDNPCSRWNSSFPSGHSTFSFTQAFITAHHYPKFKVPVFTYATVVGLSRIYLKKHYPSDVIAGALLGILTGYLTVELID
jgi:membrane-associated phospholipid phosphatase